MFPFTVPVDLTLSRSAASMSPVTLPLTCTCLPTMSPWTRPVVSTVTRWSARSMDPSTVPLTTTSPLPAMSPLITMVVPTVAVEVSTGSGLLSRGASGRGFEAAPAGGG